MFGLNKKANKVVEKGVYLVQLHDGRIKEFKTQEKADEYAVITSGRVIDIRPPVVERPKVKQFGDRT